VHAIEASLADEIAISAEWFRFVNARGLRDPKTRDAFEARLLAERGVVTLHAPRLPREPAASSTALKPEDRLECNLPALLASTRYRMTLEQNVLVSRPLKSGLGQTPLSTLLSLKGSQLTEIAVTRLGDVSPCPSDGADLPRYERFYRLLPSTSQLLVDGRDPQLLLGAVPSLSVREAGSGPNPILIRS